MDVTLLAKGTLKLRSKGATLVVDPTVSDRAKAEDADVVLLMQRGGVPEMLPPSARLVVAGSGEYEIAGVKITATKKGEYLVYAIRVDSTEMLLARSESLKAVEEGNMKEFPVVVLRVDETVNASLLTALSPRVVILYGRAAEGAASALGGGSASSKVNVTTQRLPQEREVVVLQ